MDIKSRGASSEAQGNAAGEGPKERAVTAKTRAATQKTKFPLAAAQLSNLAERAEHTKREKTRRGRRIFARAGPAEGAHQAIRSRAPGSASYGLTLPSKETGLGRAGDQEAPMMPSTLGKAAANASFVCARV